MINAKKLDAAIHAKWYEALDKAFPNWDKFPGKGSAFKSMDIRIPKSRYDLWHEYKEKVLEEWRNSK